MITRCAKGLSPRGAFFVQIGGGRSEADTAAALVRYVVEDVVDRAACGQVSELGGQVLLQGLVALRGLAPQRTVHFFRDVADQ